ncbi:MAG: hypothetical protein RMM51_07270 [Verrucomicrobiae bacterium]|nr:hypothetical protein [Verrucomicrobiae bacterium]
MKFQTAEYPFKLLTPCFCGGADNRSGAAELRIPSIRGQIRLWHRSIAPVNVVNQIWGTTEGNTTASKVGLSLDKPFTPSRMLARLLPHCDPNSKDEEEKRKAASKRDALAENQRFVLIAQRLIGCTQDDWEEAQRAIKLWLLLGGLGLRSNRAAGSVWPDGQWVPDTQEALAEVLRVLRCNHTVLLVDPQEGDNATRLREFASNTLRGPQHRPYFGGINPRQSSPVRFKVIQLGGTPRVLVTSPNSSLAEQAKSALRQSNKPLGQRSWDLIFPLPGSSI